MARKMIPDEVRRRVEDVVEEFNRKHLLHEEVRYVPRFRGSFLYLDREVSGRLEPICRLKYTGNFQKWEFAIFKYSSETYDPDEWMFPGSECVNGTIEGAIRAGQRAYPC